MARKKRAKSSYNTEAGLRTIRKSKERKEYAKAGGEARMALLSTKEKEEFAKVRAKNSWTKEARAKRIQNRLKRKARKV